MVEQDYYQEYLRLKTWNEAVMLSVEDAAVVLDEQGKCVFVNPAAERILDQSGSSLLGKHYGSFFRLLNPEGKQYADVDPVVSALQGQAFSDNQESLMLKGREPLPIRVTVSPVRLLWRTIGAVIIFDDFSREKEVDRMKTEFVSLAAHQLQTPITALKWNLETTLEALRPDGCDQKMLIKNHEDLMQIVKHLDALVHTLLNVTRLDLGLVGVEPKKVELKKLCEDLKLEFAPGFKKKKQKFLCPKSVSGFVMTDPILLSSILQNFISNANKYTLIGGTVTAGMQKTKEAMTISISDTGIGIPKKEQKRVWSKFFRASNTGDIQGNGLGLYIVKRLSELIGATVGFTSKEGKGTTFFITLPLTPPPSKLGIKKIAINLE